MFKVEITEFYIANEPQVEWKQIADSGNKQDNGPVYDYVTHPQLKEIVKETKVFEQTVTTLNLANVIRAINEISG